MRHLVACPTCRRQVDATGLSPGEAFPCVCGARVTVGAPRVHDAAVVRCSACGGTRQGGEEACGWCGSAFTLRAQDLHTICPQCATRISDRARFCHACGVPVAAQPPGARDPAQTCPACAARPALLSRVLAGAPPLLECERCAGLWVTPDDLRVLVLRAGRAGGTEDLAALVPGPAPAARAAPATTASGPLYRPCVRCGERMNRTRFAGRTSVVVDYCRLHGVWFDGDELARALEEVGPGRQVVRGTDGAPTLPGERDRARELGRMQREAAWRAEGPLGRDTFGGAAEPGLGVRVTLGVLEAALRLFF